MSPLIHALIAWLLAWAILRDPNDRRLAVIAGVAPDIDGGFILFSQTLFLAYHHTFAHSFVFGLPVALLAATLAGDRWKTGLAALGGFALHLLSDIVGTDWPVAPLYPLSDVSYSLGGTVPAVVLYGAIDSAVAAIVIVAVLAIMYYREVSPLDFFSRRLDRWFVSRWVYPLKKRCDLCGRWALGPCATCGRAMCGRHLRGFVTTRCVECQGPAGT